MMIQTHELNHTQYLQIEALERTCREAENLSGSIFIDSSDNFNPEIPCFFLLYHNSSTLICALSLYLPYEDEAEIRAYTHPHYRRQHCFLRLFTTACRVLNAWDISAITFPVDGRSESGRSTLQALYADYCYSEYLMKQDCHVSHPVALPFSDTSLSAATQDQLEALARLHSDAFCDDYAVSKELLSSVFADPNSSLYAYTKKGILLGVCCVSTSSSSDKAMVFGIAIHTSYQKKGYGYDMMCRLRSAYSLPLFLHVGSYNETAVSLYQKLGFSVAEQLDYYEFRPEKA